MKTIKCQLCDHKATSGNLVPHLKEEHPEVSIKDYMTQFGGEDSLMDPTLMAKAKEEAAAKQKPAKQKKTTGEMMDLCGVEFPKRTGLSEELKLQIPKANPVYRMQPMAETVAFDISKSNPVALSGHCGTGKTSLIYQMAALTGNPVIRVNTNQQTSIADFVGTWVVKATETGTTMEWIDGALPYAMRHGCWLIIDEIDYAEPAILSALNAVLEPARTLMLKQKGNESIVAHEDFRIFATGNTLGQMAEYRSLYQGTSIMNEAFVDRWRLHIVDYLPTELEVEVLTASVQGMTAPTARNMVKVAACVRKAFLEETGQSTFSTRRLIDWGEMMVHFARKKLARNAPMKAAESTVLSKISREDATAFTGYVQRVFFTKS